MSTVEQHVEGTIEVSVSIFAFETFVARRPPVGHLSNFVGQDEIGQLSSALCISTAISASFASPNFVSSVRSVV
jgi:hypothetical protein